MLVPHPISGSKKKKKKKGSQRYILSAILWTHSLENWLNRVGLLSIAKSDRNYNFGQ